MAEDIGRRLKYAENGYKDGPVTCMLGVVRENRIRRAVKRMRSERGKGDNVLDVNF